MAVRFQHTHDGGIVERRLRPIYDWLDNGNNKKALQEAEKVLKKSPTSQAARALKALALFRLGKGPEAHAVLDALAEEKPNDDTTLQAMTITYRESQQLEKVCSIYEAAVQAQPGNEELHSHLFMSYVRVRDPRAQHRAAMQLYKFAPKNPYYFWAVMSIVLQAKTSDDSTKRGILLALAQRMVDNFISENKMEAEQEARLYIMILELQDKWEDILKFVESPLYSQLVPGSMPQASIPYLKKLGYWKRLNLICKDLLWENQDRWDYFMPYFDSVFELMKTKSPCNEESAADDSAEKCHEFICQLVESMPSGRTLRGPYLARLELFKRLSVDGDPTSLLGSGLALCVQYLRVFAHKPCAVPDLRAYLAMIPQEEREAHCMDFLMCLDFDVNSEPDNVDDIQRHISCMSAWRLAAPALGSVACLSLAHALRRHYVRSLAQGLVTATPTEFCSADGYAILAAHHYFFAAVLAESVAPVAEALSLLELVLHHSPAHFHAKLLLLRLYHLLGNALAADTVYQRLELKHVQLVSLGWLHAARLAPACAPARALQLLADTCAFHHHHHKDSVEHVTYAYKYGTFEKLVELVGWGARLDACAWCGAAARERALLALLAGPEAPLHAPHPLPPHPTDSRDLEAVVGWEPAQFHEPRLKARTFDQELAYLRLKDGLVSAIALCIECAQAPAERNAQLEELAACVDAFGAALDCCRERYAQRERISIAGPYPCRIIALVNSPVPYRELYTSSLRLVGALCASRGRDGGGVSRAHALCGEAARAVAAAGEALRGEAAAAGVGLTGTAAQLETLANYLEFIGIITYLLGVCNELVTPATKKSKKKIQKSPDELETCRLLAELNQEVQRSIAQLEDLFDNLPTHDYQPSLEEEFSRLSMTDCSYQCPVRDKLRTGHQVMVTDIKNILNKKCKYLKSLVQ